MAGKDDGNPNVASENTLKAMEEAKKSPTKYKMAEVLGKFALNSDQRNSWNAVRSLRSMAAVVVSFVGNILSMMLWKKVSTRGMPEIPVVTFDDREIMIDQQMGIPIYLIARRRKRTALLTFLKYCHLRCLISGYLIELCMPGKEELFSGSRRQACEKAHTYRSICPGIACLKSALALSPIMARL